MGTPFCFGAPVDRKDFTGHSREVECLVSAMSEGRNVMLVSARKYGRTSIINRATDLVGRANPSLRFCYMNFREVRDEASLCVLFAQELIKSFSAGWEQAAQYLKVYFPDVESKLSVNGTTVKDISISVDIKDMKDPFDRFLAMASQMASDRDVRLVLCIDDFHNVLNLQDPQSLLRKFRKHVYGKENITLVLSWSRDFMMQELFDSLPKSHRNFGTLIEVGRIDDADFHKLLQEHFAEGTKFLDLDVASYITDLVDGHPYYVQQLAQQAWLRTCIVCTKEIVWEAYRSLVDQMSLMFQYIMEGLTPQQLSYLRAVVAGETVISSAGVLHRYGISSATSATRSKAALLQKDILMLSKGKVVVSDPLMLYWLKNIYFV